MKLVPRYTTYPQVGAALELLPSGSAPRPPMDKSASMWYCNCYLCPVCHVLPMSCPDLFKQRER
jgi:hypothetical protein